MSDKKYTYFICFFLLVYVAISFYKLSSPGVQYDELLFVNAAMQNRCDSSFIFIEWQNFPVLLMAYIGALKSYLYYPILNCLGVSIYTLRLPVILITVASLVVITKISNKFFFKGFSLLVLILLVLDPAFIYMTRLDVGPSVLELVTKCMACFFFYKYFFEKKKVKILILGIVFLALGMFNKLNFLWFINAFYALLIIMQYSVIKKAILDKDLTSLKPYFIIGISYLFFLVYFIYIYIAFGLANSDVNPNYLYSKCILLVGLIDGTNYLKYIYNVPSNTCNELFVFLYALIISIGIILNLSYVKNEFIRQYRRAYFFILLVVLFEGIQIGLTQKATAPWHVFTLYPFLTIILAYSIYTIYYVVRKKLLSNIILIGLTSLITIYHILTLDDYFKALGTPPTNINWSDKIYDLINFTHENNGQFISMDWGIHNQLIAFDTNKDRYNEIFPFFIKDEPITTKEWVKSTYFTKNVPVYIIAHTQKYQINKEIFPNFLKFSQEMNLEVIPFKIINDSKRDVFLIYIVHPKKNK